MNGRNFLLKIVVASLLFVGLLVSTLFTTSRAVAAEQNDCVCPKLACDADCETQSDLTFYSEKCSNGDRVKSCSRPTCVALEDAPANCKAAKAQKPVEPVREIASEKPVAQPMVVGRVKFLEPDAFLKDSSGKKTDLIVGGDIHEKDRIATSEKGKVQIEFTNGNKLNITPNSEVVINEASDAVPSAEKKRMVLDLIKGKVRNKVNVKYDGEQSYYQVKTRTAVAGVRGTEFVVSVDDDSNQFVSKIETLEGQVELTDMGRSQKTFVAKNETASYVVNHADLMKAGDKAVGRLTPNEKMSEDYISDLNRNTLFESPGSEAKSVAKHKSNVQGEDMPICAAPSAKLNQCAWVCENNPKGEKNCRTDLPKVNCVRRICNANGKWSSPTRLPASYHGSCAGEDPVVKSCDY